MAASTAIEQCPVNFSWRIPAFVSASFPPVASTKALVIPISRSAKAVSKVDTSRDDRCERGADALHLDLGNHSAENLQEAFVLRA
ncbi:MAG TPA: hypothetical protein VJ501_15370 [Burkholderiaceae bacterium]|nr:hypothetical protein [Burkholderiaceae bacterium]